MGNQKVQCINIVLFFLFSKNKLFLHKNKKQHHNILWCKQRHAKACLYIKKMAVTQTLILYSIIIISIAIVVLLFISTKTNRKIKNIFDNLKLLKKDVDKIHEAEKELAGVISGEKDPATLTFWKQNKEKVKEKKISFFKKTQNKIKDFSVKIKEKMIGAEEFAGKQVIDKIGIIIFLAGIAFFVGFSIEYDWINSIGRVFFGSILAVVLLLIGYFLRNKFDKFSSVLIGGGVATLIFTVFAAFYQYEIIGVIPSFAILFLLVGLAVFLSIIFDNEIITILAFLAGFIAPFTVSFAPEDYIILFSYLIILNIAVLAYDYFKKSILINLFSYVFTFIFYAGWLITQFVAGKEIPYLTAFIFLSVFYVMIFIILIINNIRENRKFIPIEFTAIVFGTAMYYTAGLIIIEKAGIHYKGLFTGLIAIVNYIYMLILYNRKNYDRNIMFLFMALSLMFIGLVVPVELVGGSVTLVWALEAVLMLFISQKTKIPTMKIASVGLSLGMIGSLGIELFNTYISTTSDLVMITPIFNKAFLSTIIAIISLTFNIYLLKNEKKPYIVLPFFKINVYKAILATAAFFAFYFSVRFEIKYAIIQTIDYNATISTIIGIYNFAFIFLLMLPALFKNIKVLHIVNAALGVIALGVYLFYYSGQFAELRNEYLLSANVSLSHFRLHFINAALLFFILIIAFRSVIKLIPKENYLSYIASIIFVFGTVYLLSSEIDQFLTLKLYKPNVLIQEILSKTHRLPYTLTWTVSSLIFVFLGFILKNKSSRIIASLLYIVALGKLFIVDFKFLTNQDLMIAFFTMGTVLLIASFLFQNFSKFIKTPKKIKEVKKEFRPDTNTVERPI